MKSRLRYIKYMLLLHDILGMFSCPMEWSYDYRNMTDTEVLRLMAALLANRGGNVHQFTLRWRRVHDKHFANRANIQELEARFCRALKLNIPSGL